MTSFAKSATGPRLPSRRVVMAGAAAVAVSSAFIAVPAVATVPTFEETVERLTLDMEALGFKFVVHFRDGKRIGLFVGIARVQWGDDVESGASKLNMLSQKMYKEDPDRYEAKLVSMGRHNRLAAA